MMIFPKVRTPINGVFKAFFQKLFIRIYISLAIYVSAIITLLFYLSLWDITFLKDTVFWFVLAGLPLIFQDGKRTSPGYFKHLFVKSITITVVLEFIINLHTMSLIYEFILFPILVLIIMMSIFTDHKPEHSQLKSCLNWILSFVGIVLLIYGVDQTIDKLPQTDIREVITKILLPVVLVVGIIPYLYCLALYSIYEQVLLMIRLQLKDTFEYGYIKRRLFFVFNIKLRLIRLVKKNIYKLPLYESKFNKYDLETFIKDIKKEPRS